MNLYHFFSVIMLAAVFVLGGCASKGSVTVLDGRVESIQQQWQAFSASYDPATRAELAQNLTYLEGLNNEVTQLREEVRLKSARVAELLRQVDHNEIDQAIQLCHRNADEAYQYSISAQNYSQAAMVSYQNAQHEVRNALHWHEKHYHNVDMRKLLSRIDSLTKKVNALQKCCQSQKKDGDDHQTERLKKR